jgi:hypothetical protein
MFVFLDGNGFREPFCVYRVKFVRPVSIFVFQEHCTPRSLFVFRGHFVCVAYFVIV